MKAWNKGDWQSLVVGKEEDHSWAGHASLAAAASSPENNTALESGQSPTTECSLAERRPLLQQQDIGDWKPDEDPARNDAALETSHAEKHSTGTAMYDLEEDDENRFLPASCSERGKKEEESGRKQSPKQDCHSKRSTVAVDRPGTNGKPPPNDDERCHETGGGLEACAARAIPTLIQEDHHRVGAIPVSSFSLENVNESGRFPNTEPYLEQAIGVDRPGTNRKPPPMERMRHETGGGLAATAIPNNLHEDHHRVRAIRASSSENVNESGRTWFPTTESYSERAIVYSDGTKHPPMDDEMRNETGGELEASAAKAMLSLREHQGLVRAIHEVEEDENDDLVRAIQASLDDVVSDKTTHLKSLPPGETEGASIQQHVESSEDHDDDNDPVLAQALMASLREHGTARPFQTTPQPEPPIGAAAAAAADPNPCGDETFCRSLVASLGDTSVPDLAFSAEDQFSNLDITNVAMATKPGSSSSPGDTEKPDDLDYKPPPRKKSCGVPDLQHTVDVQEEEDANLAKALAASLVNLQEDAGPKTPFASSGPDSKQEADSMNGTASAMPPLKPLPPGETEGVSNRQGVESSEDQDDNDPVLAQALMASLREQHGTARPFQTISHPEPPIGAAAAAADPNPCGDEMFCRSLVASFGDTSVPDLAFSAEDQFSNLDITDVAMATKPYSSSSSGDTEKPDDLDCKPPPRKKSCGVPDLQHTVDVQEEEDAALAKALAACLVNVQKDAGPLKPFACSGPDSKQEADSMNGTASAMPHLKSLPPGEAEGVSNHQRVASSEDYHDDNDPVLAQALMASLREHGTARPFQTTLEQEPPTGAAAAAADPNPCGDETFCRSLVASFGDTSVPDLAFSTEDQFSNLGITNVAMATKPCSSSSPGDTEKPDDLDCKPPPRKKSCVPDFQHTVDVQEEEDAALAKALAASLVNVQEDAGPKTPFASSGPDSKQEADSMNGAASAMPSSDHAPHLDGMVIECALNGGQELGLFWRSDAEYARSLQEQFDRSDQHHSSASGLATAWQLVERVLDLQEEYRLQQRTRGMMLVPAVSDAMKEVRPDTVCSCATVESNPSRIEAIGIDDMIPMAEKLIATQHEYRRQGKPVHVDIGYHWTRAQNLDRIQTDGLLTKEERDSLGIRAAYHGSKLGDGIYTANDPYSFCRKYGLICIMVARLQGVVTAGSFPNSRAWWGADTVVSSNGLIHVLASSGQCIPLLYFSADLINLYSRHFLGNAWVHEHHVKLQEVVDTVLNHGSDNKTPVPKVLCLADAKEHFERAEQDRRSKIHQTIANANPP